MKTKSDPRHRQRIKIVKALYEKIMRPNASFTKTSVTGEILTHIKPIDKLITQNAPAWPLNQIAPIDLAILCLAIWELIYKKQKEPYKVIVDEAVEIAKEFGGASSPKFVNGVLGTIIKSKIKDHFSQENLLKASISK